MPNVKLELGGSLRLCLSANFDTCWLQNVRVGWWKQWDFTIENIPIMVQLRGLKKKLQMELCNS